MINQPLTYDNRHIWNKINILTVIVIFINYFNIYWHYWFVELLGGYVIKLWLPPFLLIFFIVVQIFMRGQDITVKKDNLSIIKLFGVLYFSFGFISLIAHDEGMWYIGKYSLFMFMPVVLFAIIIARFKDNKDIKMILLILFLGGLLISLYVEYLYFTGNLHFKTLSTNVGEKGFVGDSTSFASAFEVSIRHEMPGLGISTYSALLLPLVFVGLYLGKYYSGILKYFFYTSTVFIFYALTSTLSRAAFISVIVGLVLLQWYNRRKYLMFVFIILLAVFVFLLNKLILVRILALLVAVDFLPGSEYINEFLQQFNFRYVTDPHITSLEKSFAAFLESPFFGVGMSEMKAIHEHDRYIEVLASNGLAGFVPYAAMIISMIILARKRLLIELKKNSFNKDIGIILYAGLVSFAIYLNAHSSESYFYWIWFGLTMAWVRNCAFDRQVGKQIMPRN